MPIYPIKRKNGGRAGVLKEAVRVLLLLSQGPWLISSKKRVFPFSLSCCTQNLEYKPWVGTIEERLRSWMGVHLCSHRKRK